MLRAQCLQVGNEIVELIILDFRFWEGRHRSQTAAGLHPDHEAGQGLVVERGTERCFSTCVTLMAMLEEDAFSAKDAG